MVREFRVVCWTDQHLFFPGAARGFLINPRTAGPRCSKGHSAAIRGPYRREIRREIKSKTGTHDASQVKQPDDLAGTQRLRIDSRGGHSRSIGRQREIVVRICSGFPRVAKLFALAVIPTEPRKRNGTLPGPEC